MEFYVQAFWDQVLHLAHKNTSTHWSSADFHRIPSYKHSLVEHCPHFLSYCLKLHSLEFSRDSIHANYSLVSHTGNKHLLIEYSTLFQLADLSNFLRLGMHAYISTESQQVTSVHEQLVKAKSYFQQTPIMDFVLGCFDKWLFRCEYLGNIYLNFYNSNGIWVFLNLWILKWNYIWSSSQCSPFLIKTV